jgi:hypothetical protein
MKLKNKCIFLFLIYLSFQLYAEGINDSQENKINNLLVCIGKESDNKKIYELFYELSKINTEYSIDSLIYVLENNCLF